MVYSVLKQLYLWEANLKRAVKEIILCYGRWWSWPSCWHQLKIKRRKSLFQGLSCRQSCWFDTVFFNIRTNLNSWQEETVLVCTSGGLDGTLGRMCSLKGLSDAETGCPVRWWNPDPRRDWRDVLVWCLGLWFTGDLGGLREWLRGLFPPNRFCGSSLHESF